MCGCCLVSAVLLTVAGYRTEAKQARMAADELGAEAFDPDAVPQDAEPTPDLITPAGAAQDERAPLLK